MKKKLKSRVIASLLAISMVVGNLSGFVIPVSAQSGSGDYANYTTDVQVADFKFGTDVTGDTLYTPELGYGFSDVEYPNPASGWVNGIYNPRIPVYSETAGYVQAVSGSALSMDILESGSKTWTETESTGYGVYTYENTSVFKVDLDNADYDVKVTLANPTDTAYTAYIEAEDITKATGITVTPGATVETTIRAVLVDGQLSLKFIAHSAATGEASATLGKVYVSNVSIIRKATNEAAEKPTIFIASDSTVQTYESSWYPQSGWGQTLYNFFGEFVGEKEAENCTYSQAQTYETKNVVIENRAIGGRSSKSFIDEGKLDDLLEDVKPGDYVLVQWGHNDATYSRPNRYVSATDFPEVLKYYIDGVKQRGGTCVLVTPVARYSPRVDGSFNSDFEAYRQAMITLGTQQNVPVLDLTGASLALAESLGVEGAKSLFLHLAAGDYEGAYAGGVSDSTHLQFYGAFKFAQCVAKLIGSYSTDNQLDTLKTLVELNAPTTVPSAVANVVTTSVGATSVNFTWDSAEGAELYYIYRAELTADQTIESVDFTNAQKYSVSSVKKFTDKNCLGGKTYVYAVRAFNEFGLGEISSKIMVTTKSALYKYDFGLSTSAVMQGWYQVTSTQLFNAELGYGWITAPNNGRDRAGNGLIDSSAMADDFCLGEGEFAVNLPNGDYEVKIYAGDLLTTSSTIKPSYTAEGASIGGISVKQAIGTVSANVRVTDGQLNVNVGGANPYINGMEITPLLLAPSNLSYSELDFTDTNATFLVNFDGIDSAVTYKIYQKSSTDQVFSLVKTIAAADKDSLDARAMVANIGETRQYYVTAVVADGTESAPSDSIIIEMTDKNALPPEKVVNIKCILAEEARIEIGWDVIKGAISYNVYRSARLEGTKGYAGYKKVGNTNTASFVDTDSDIDTNIPYYYKVEAVGKGGVGELSAPFITPITDRLVREKAEILKDRALVAVDLAGNKGAEINVTTKDAEGNELIKGVYLSWRLFENDPKDVKFTIYRNDMEIASELTVTNCVDPEGKSGDVYKVVGSSDSSQGLSTVATSTWKNYYIEMQLEKPVDQIMPDGTSCTYTANDMSVGDLNNDGDYELIVKWSPSNSKDNSGSGYTGTTILDAYNIDSATGAATLMWRIDLGVNIRSGAHYTQFQVWDFDGDGSAELMCKTADGSTAYQNIGGVLTETGYVGASSASALPTDKVSATNDYRNTSGYILSGPEYLTVFDGETGRIIDTADYVPARGSVSAWGDAYGNRVDRFLSAVAYLDGENASAVFSRGYYTRTCLTAYDFVDTNNDSIGDKLQVRWKFDTNDYPVDKYGELEAQGNHGLSVNDIDNDGKDEIIFGALVVEHDGSLKYATGLGHGDAMHVSDWIPSNPGLEIFSVHEHSNAKYQVEIHDAETGEVLWGYFTGVDTGRGVTADIDPNYEGGEMWANAAWDGTNGGLYSSLSTLAEFIKISNTTPDVNFSIFWDGDLLSELQNHSFNTSAYVPISTNITKWNYTKKISEKLLDSTEIYTVNGTKGNMGLVADVLGDWREEIISRSSADNSKIRIYTSTIYTDYAIPCLMENSTYRLGVAWQNVGYNQPANLDYLISEGIKTAKLTLGKVTKSSVTFNFTAASDSIYGYEVEGYEIYRKSGIGEYELIDKLTADTLTYTDNKIDSDKNYSYSVAAVIKGRTSYLSIPLDLKTLVDITSIVDFNLEDIVEDTPIPLNGTVNDLLPAVLQVIDSNDNKTTANVIWDVGTLNIAEPGVYKVNGSIEGYSGTIEKTVKIIPNTIMIYEFAGYTKTSDVEPYYSNYVVENAKSLELPTKVNFSYLNSTTEEVTVTWDTSAVDVTTKGTYVTIGTTTGLAASDGKFGTQTVKMNVVVKDDYIIGFEEIPSVEAVIGSTINQLKTILPSTLNVIYKSGNKNVVNVIWNTDIAESLLEAEGNFDVAGTVADYSGEVKIKVYTEYKAVWRFDFGISTNDVETGWTGITVNSKGGKKTADALGIVYSLAKGYGFSNSSAIIEGRNESYTQSGILPPKVYRDFVLPDGQTLLADVPNGTYNIEFTSGSSSKSSVKVTVENSTSVFTVGNAANTYSIGKVKNVVVTDGQISMYFATGNTSRLGSIVIREVSEVAPTEKPTATPTVAPTEKPTVAPTEKPTVAPTEKPTVAPTEKPTVAPTEKPTVAPTGTPTVAPTATPTVAPTETPTVAPTETPTVAPTEIPTVAPTATPTPVEPSIDGVDNTKGWNDIIEFLSKVKVEEQNTKDIVIHVGQNTIVPKEAILAIKDMDVTVELKFQGYSWKINGLDIKGESVEDIDLSLKENIKAIPNSVITSVAGENNYYSLQLSHNGEFGFNASLVIGLKEENKGKIANLFYYDPITKTLQLQSVHRVDNRGYAELSFTHASDYVIIFDDKVLLNDGLTNIKTSTTAKTLYLGGNTGKSAILNIQWPNVMKEAMDKELVRELITYESNNKKVATVSANGKITAKGKGRAVITTTITIGDITKTFTNTITVTNAYLRIVGKTNTMKVGDMYTFEVKSYGFKQSEVKYTTSQKSVVVISKSTGKAVAVAKGIDYIVATCGNIFEKIKVIVK